MPFITGSVAATVSSEVMAAKNVEAALRATRKAIRGMDLITSVVEREVEASDITRGAMLLKPGSPSRFELKSISIQTPEVGKTLCWEELPTTKKPEITRPDLEREPLKEVDNSLATLSSVDFPHSKILESFLVNRDEMTKVERHPGKMAKEAAVRISKIAPTDLEWKRMTPNQRLDILQRCYSIMAEEACLPKKLVEKTKFSMKWMPGENANTTTFVEEVNSQSWRASEITPTISFSEQNLKNRNYDFTSCVSTLYHETMHVLQQQCLLESGDTIPYPEMKKEWAEALRKHTNGIDNYNDGLGYLSTAIEIHAIQQQALFRRMLNICTAERKR